MSGERARLACWRWCPRHRELSAETFTEGNEDGEEAAELDLFANTFVSFVAFCEDF
jgi:hypothetical protein